MTVLKISDLTYSYNDKILFDNVSLFLTSGQKVALVGQNGSGKSTLLDLVFRNKRSVPSAGLSPLKREISILGSVEYITQSLGLRPENNVLEFLMEQSLDWVEVWQMLESDFSFESKLEAKVSDLSHGEYLKLKLAVSLSKNPDLLLLDEPTNNLDRDSILSLGQILKSYHGSVLVVSHDPVFLDMFVGQVLELSCGKIQLFGGNYEFYSQQKELETARKNELYNLAKKDLKHTLKAQKEAVINAQHRLIKGKKDAAKSNLGKAEQNFFKNKSEVKSGQNKNKFDRMISAKESELAQNTPNINYPIHFKFNNNQIKNKRLLEIKRGQLKVGQKTLLQDIDFEVYSGQKILIEGKNGSGKSSFLKGVLKMLPSQGGLEIIVESEVETLCFAQSDTDHSIADKILKQVQDDRVRVHDHKVRVQDDRSRVQDDKVRVQDDRVRVHDDENSTFVAAIKDRHENDVKNESVFDIGDNFYFSKNLKIEYLDQNYSLVNQDLSLEQNLKLVDPELSLTDLYKLLAYFQFSKNDGNRLAKTLSGGELVRLNLAVLTLKNVDILILDEPTNNLDISTLEVLLKVLKEFQGALILVCHNQWFCSQIDFDKVYNIESSQLNTIKKGLTTIL